MGDYTFDTLKFADTLEAAGFPREQARAITDVVRTSHMVADVATKADIAELKRDITDVRKDMSAQIADVRKDMSAQIADVRKDMATRFEKTDADIASVRKELKSDISVLKKEMEGRFTLLQWMLGFLIAVVTSIALKMFL